MMNGDIKKSKPTPCIIFYNFQIKLLKGYYSSNSYYYCYREMCSTKAKPFLNVISASKRT